MPSFDFTYSNEELPLYRDGGVEGALVDIEADISVEYDADDFSYHIERIRLRAYGAKTEYVPVRRTWGVGVLIEMALGERATGLDDIVAERVSDAMGEEADIEAGDRADYARDVRHEAA